jgi:hypothetical protein
VAIVGACQPPFSIFEPGVSPEGMEMEKEIATAPSKSEFVYIGFKPCGCGVAVVVDDPKYVKSTAESVSEFIREGLKIERVSMDDYPARFNGCKCIPDGTLI